MNLRYCYLIFLGNMLRDALGPGNTSHDQKYTLDQRKHQARWILMTMGSSEMVIQLQNVFIQQIQPAVFGRAKESMVGWSGKNLHRHQMFWKDMNYVSNSMKRDCEDDETDHYWYCLWSFPRRSQWRCIYVSPYNVQRRNDQWRK